MTYQDPFGNTPFGQYPGGPPPVFSAPPQPPSGKANRFATLSLVFAFLFAPAGAVFGHLGLAQIQRTGERGRDRALIGTVLSYVVIVTVIVGLVIWSSLGEPSSASTTVATQSSAAARSRTSTTPPAPPPPTKIEAGGMATLLPSLDDMRRLMNNQTLVDAGSSDSIFPVPPDLQTFDPPECVNSMNSFTPSVYQDSGYRAVYSVTQNQVPVADMQISEGVAIFDNAAAAQKVVDANITLFRQCAGRTLSWSFVKEGRSADFILGSPETVGGVTGVRNSNPGPNNMWTARAVAAKANVVVEIQMLAANVTDQHFQTAKLVLDRIPG